MEIHLYLIDAQAQRTLADYDTNSIASQEDVEEILDQAQALLAIALQNLTVD
jgi:uncharacterized protein (UPF0332 family)